MSRCFTPIQILPKIPNHNGSAQKSDSETRITVPCGQCIGCRFNRAENWASRMMHEASLHENNSFITLTYSDANLPLNGNLAPTDVTLFIKRLRKALNCKKILYYYCGEYGDQFSRPHYHIALFGHDFSTDRVPHYKTDTGFQTYRSPHLEKLWTLGNSEIGNLEYDSVRYVAGYIQKKVNGKKAAAHYTKIDPHSGEIHAMLPEFARMSRRPAIGLNWLEKFHTDIYNHDVCIVGDKKLRPPAYYDKWLKKTDLEQYEKIKMSRDSTIIGCSLDTARLTKTYEAKVIASKKIHRSLEGMPAHISDSERLAYQKNTHELQHFIEKEKKWKLQHQNLHTSSAQSMTTKEISSGLLNSSALKPISSEPANQAQKTQNLCLINTPPTTNSTSSENGTNTQASPQPKLNALALS